MHSPQLSCRIFAVHMHPQIFCDSMCLNPGAFVCLRVCQRKRERRIEGKKSNVLHSKIRVFLSSSIIVQFFLRGASIYCCLPKGQQSHTRARTQIAVCLIAELDTELVEGRLRDGEGEREMKAGFYSAVQPTQRASKGFVKKKCSVSLSLSPLLSFSALP